MTHIEQMIKDLCPNGVEWKAIGDILGVNRGKRLTKSELSEDGDYEVYHGSKDTPLGCYAKSNAPKDTVIVVNTGGIGGVKYLDKDFWCSDGSFWIGHSDAVNNKFLYYFLSRYEDYFESQKRVGGVPTIDRKVIENFKIPLPPLEIQEKIVECLDKFSALAAELQAELQKRRQQYEYYRTRLLTPPQNISSDNSTDERNWEWKTLGELCISIKDGMHNLPKSTLEETEYPIISAQNIYENSIDYVTKRYVDKETFDKENKRTNVEVGDVLLTIVATIGRSAVVTENKPVLLQRSVCVLKPSKLIIPEFLKYSLDTNRVQSYMIANAHGAAQAGLYLNQVEQIKIPIPPIEEQKRIATLLNKFNKLTTSLSDGIPAEQAAQQKRYEYYSDLLLTF